MTNPICYMHKNCYL